MDIIAKPREDNAQSVLAPRENQIRGKWQTALTIHRSRTKYEKGEHSSLPNINGKRKEHKEG